MNTDKLYVIQFGISEIRIGYLSSNRKNIQFIKFDNQEYLSTKIQLNEENGKIKPKFGMNMTNTRNKICTISEILRFLGLFYFSLTNELRNKTDCMIVENKQNGYCDFNVRYPSNGLNEILSPETVMKMFVQFIKETIHKYFKNETFSRIVLIVPSFFDDYQIDLFRKIYYDCEMNIIGMLNDSIAAVNEHVEITKSTKRSFLIIKLDYTSTEISLCLKMRKSFEMKSFHSTDSFCLNQINELLKNQLKERIKLSGKSLDIFTIISGDNDQTRKQKERNNENLMREVNKIRKAFVTQTEVKLSLNTFYHNKEIETITISRNEFERKIKSSGIIEQMKKSFYQFFQTIHYLPNQVEQVLFIGEQFPFQLIRECIDGIVGQNKIVENNQFDGVNSVLFYGAKLFSDMFELKTHQPIRIEKSFGIDVNGKMNIIIPMNGERNKEYHQRFTIYFDSNNKACVLVYQGNEINSVKNCLLMKWIIVDNTMSFKGNVDVIITMKIEENSKLLLKCRSVSGKEFENKIIEL